MKKNLKNKYITDYNNLISTVFYEGRNFHYKASPTLRKQETVTFLFEKIINNKKSNSLVNKISLFFEFTIRFIYHFFLLTLFSLLCKVKKRTISKKNVYLRSWLVPKSFFNKEIKDQYFKKLIKILNDKNENPIVGLHTLNYKLIFKYFFFRKKKNFLIPIGLLSIKDIFLIFYEYLFNARIKLKNKYFFDDRNVTILIEDSLSEDYFKMRSFLCYVEKKIAEKIKLFQPKALIYIFENQSWEESYNETFKNEKILIAGYQSSGFSLRYLNFFPTELDAKVYNQPDIIYTVGDIFGEILNKYGSYNCDIITLGAARFDYSKGRKKYLIEKQNKKLTKRILYAFSVNENQYPLIINKLIKVFINSQISVDLKFHPLFNQVKLNIDLPKNFKIIDSIKMSLLRKKYDYVIFNDNSFGIEALINGVKSYEFIFQDKINERRLFYFNDYNSTLNSNQLSHLVDKYEENNKLFNAKSIEDYINKFYTPLIEKNHLIEQLQKSLQ